MKVIEKLLESLQPDGRDAAEADPSKPDLELGRSLDDVSRALEERLRLCEERLKALDDLEEKCQAYDEMFERIKAWQNTVTRASIAGTCKLVEAKALGVVATPEMVDQPVEPPGFQESVEEPPAPSGFAEAMSRSKYGMHLPAVSGRR